MFKVIAIREKTDGTRWQNEWMRGIPTAAEASAAVGLMLGQDGIVDGYWDDEDAPLLNIAENVEEQAARVAAFHETIAVPTPIFGLGLAA